MTKTKKRLPYILTQCCCGCRAIARGTAKQAKQKSKTLRSRGWKPAGSFNNKWLKKKCYDRQMKLNEERKQIMNDGDYRSASHGW